MLKKLFKGRRNKSASSTPESNPSASQSFSRYPMADCEDNFALLHGRLNVRVVEARNVEGESPTLFSRFERAVTSSLDGVDPYCSVKLGYNKLLQTPVVQNTASPSWDSFAVFDVCHYVDALEFRVKAAKRSGPLAIISKVKHLSMLSIRASDIVAKRRMEGWFALGTYLRELEPDDEDDTDSSDEEIEPGAPPPTGDAAAFGEIFIELAFTPVAELPDLGKPDVQNTYFPMRAGVSVSMFQNAEVSPGMLPEIPFRPDYAHGRCWAELARAIMNSTEFIYITGWAVWPELVMVRTEYEGDQWSGLTLGEMLIHKAEEGVRVCVLVWDEVASGKFYKGLMGTHDEEVIAYFRKTKVVAAKVSRQNPKDGPFADLNDSLLFTHHQKAVVVSRPDPDADGRHRVEAWVGGLDLTDGRYDTPEHPLFRTLGGVHSGANFWNACALTVGAESGPREPWHDIHAHVTGTVAWDVMTNFEGRWQRQAPDACKDALHPHDGGTFVQPAEEDEMASGSWNVQLLRSINASSTQLDNERVGLLVRRNAATDTSIHNAYVHYIRSARRFIYIENQYFLGSSHMWDSGQRGGFASNLVPIELAEKICAKIRANEPFRVYVTVPLYPEGPPDSGAVQEILSHQRKTVETITRRIASTIREVGSDTTVSDWFNMFCLVNRESMEGNEGNGGTNAVETALSQSRRFMVYVHSKFAIFDDAVAIIGSANINSRSLDGSRDTEIAIAAWQPEHLASGSTAYRGEAEETGDEEAEPPLGDVAAFRASVWSAHVGRQYMDELQDPCSEECVRKLQEVGRANWDHFAAEVDGADAVADMPFGQLAMYPYVFDENGEITTTQTHFPDFPAALIKGTATPGIPNMLTG